jgi:plastocyanin
MTLRWLIAFSAAAACFSLAGDTVNSTVVGSVILRDSRLESVAKRGNYSGVVVALTPLARLPASSSPQHFRMLQKDKTFTPHVLAIPTGAIVDFPNADPIFHNAFSSYSGQVFDVGLYPPGSSRSVRFTRPGIVRVFCNIHASMSAVVIVLDTPYFATTGNDGVFHLDAPPGEYQLTVFHERATETTLKGLERRVAIGANPLQLPPIAISEAGYLAAPHKNKFGNDYPPGLPNDSLYPGARK